MANNYIDKSTNSPGLRNPANYSKPTEELTNFGSELWYTFNKLAGVLTVQKERERGREEERKKRRKEKFISNVSSVVPT